MNTDNMSIIGETLDYGPFGFFDSYDPQWASNLSDSSKRYSFEHQPRIALWNLAKLGRTFVDLVVLPLDNGESPLPEVPEGFSVSGNEIIQRILDEYQEVFISKYTSLMRTKLGMFTEQEDDLEVIINPLLQIFTDTRVDYTNFFRSLCFLASKGDPKKIDAPCTVKGLADCRTMLQNSLSRQTRQTYSPTSQMEANMSGANEDPKHQREAPESDMLSPTDIQFQQFVNSDYEILSSKEIDDRWMKWVAQYRIRIASESTITEETRSLAMQRVNPKYCLRQWMMNEVTLLIEKDLHHPNTRQFAGKNLERMVKVVIDDVWGAVAERFAINFYTSASGWKSPEDRKFSIFCTSSGPPGMEDVAINCSN